MLLESKRAVIYGGAGKVGGAVARAFAREGARVFLAGRRLAALDKVAEEISGAGGDVETAEVDALDERTVGAHVDDVADRAGGIDVSFNAIGHEHVHGTPLTGLSFDDFFGGMTAALRAQYVTTRAAARHMIAAGGGVIMTITATTARMSIPNVGATGVTYDAIESLCRQFACELGPHGVRVVWLQSTGLPEAMQDTGELFPDYGVGPMTREQVIAWQQEKTLLNRLTSLAEVGNTAAFLASDRASAMTGTGANITGGAVQGR